MSLLGRAKGWLEKRRPAHSNRVTRAAASPSTARVSYNEDHVPLELSEDTSPARAMTFPCDEFMEAAGIKNIRTKSHGTNNPINCVKAAIEGLKSLRSAEEVAAIRGKTVEEING